MSGLGVRTVSGKVPICAGREPALAVLREQLAMAAGGAPRVVWLEGEPGVGKTTLVRAFLAEGAHRSVWATGDEAEQGLSYGILATLHSTLAASVNQTGLEGDGPSPTTDPLAAGAELLVALGASDDPLVLVVDDLQWADSRSAAALRFALRRLLGEPLLVIVVTRPDPQTSLGDGWTRLLSDRDRVTSIHLDGLTAQGIVELVSATGHGLIGQPVADRIRDHTNGNPLHIRALLDEFGDSLLRPSGVLPAPRSFTQLTLGRLIGLGPDATRLVTAGSVLGSTFPIDLAATVAEAADVDHALDRAVTAGLVERVSVDSARFSHPLVRGAVYNDISPPRLRALHQAAADATDGVRSLDHRVAAAVGKDDALAARLDRRAVRETQTGSGIVAADHFLAASRLSSSPDRRDRRFLIAVECLFSAGDYSRATALRTAVEACPDSAHRNYVLGMLDTSPRSADHFTAAAATADDETDIPQLRIRAIAGRSVAHLRQGRYEAALTDADTMVATGLEGWGSGLLRWVQVASLANLGRTVEARAILEHPRNMQTPGVELDDLTARGLVELADDDLPSAVRDLTALAQRVRAGETCRLGELALSVLATAQYWLGQWEESAINSLLAVELYGDADRQRVSVAHSVSALVHAGRGQFGLAEADVQAARDADRASATASGPFYVAMARAVLAQARGDMAELREATAPILDGRIKPSIEGFDAWSWLVLAIEGLLGTGAVDEAHRQLDRLRALAGTLRLISPTDDIARLAGQLVEASGDVDAAKAVYEAALGRPSDHPPLPLPRARLALAYGSLLRRTGSRRSAIEHLRSAHSTFASLGAAPFLTTCEAELEACGLRAPMPGMPGALQLTSAERKVAHLIVQGLTNREVATRLYVSPKTVEYHLGNIYAKLGINARRDLAKRLRPER